jgi:outer membrane protein assembly factor BamA
MPLFNTFETGIETSIEIPKFLVPISQERFPKYFKPKTTISAGYNFQKRPDFKRTISNLSFGYDWKQSRYIQHIFNPIEINAVKIYPDSAFKATIDAFADKRLKYQYTDHFILNLRYSFIYNNQDPNKKKNFTFFRANFESAGSFLNIIKRVFDDTKNQNGDYEVFNLIYSQYLRFDIELKRYLYFNLNNYLVLRTSSGIGLPYGNSRQLPYEKSFVAGGANDIRAWRLRSLGPGSYFDAKAENFDRIGDISIEFNIENRFQIYKLLHAALFVDAGNIWLNKANILFPNGEIQADKFLKQIAIGAGFGARLDFSFLLIRVDAAIPIRNPSKTTDREWVIAHSSLRDFVLNFGIGYPF